MRPYRMAPRGIDWLIFGGLVSLIGLPVLLWVLIIGIGAGWW